MIQNFTTDSFPHELQFCYCGYEDCDPDFYCGPNIRTCYLIHLITKGSGCYLLNDKEYVLKTGDIFVIFPGDIVHYKTYADDPWSFCWFAFDGALASYYFEGMVLNQNQPVFSIAEYNKLENAILKLVALTTNPKIKDHLLIIAALHEALGYIYQECASHTSKPNKENQKKYIENALLYIKYNYFNNITAKNIAKQLNIERTYFSKIFKNETGISPQQYIIHYRIRQAATLLKTSEYSATEIAQFVGFQNINYFFRTFKKETKRTPLQFRKQN